VTFAPTFLSTHPKTTVEANNATPNEDDVVELDDAKADFKIIQNASPHSAFASPTTTTPPRRGASRKQHYGRGKTGGGAGPLTKRLKQIRDGIKGDTIRFQSGQYPFRATSFDMNDPRNHATSYMDVTILGESIPWEKEHQKLTCLGYVHTHHLTTAAAAASISSSTARSQACLAWMCFTFETAREKNVQAGTKLRVYNPVVFPSRTAASSPSAEEESPLLAKAPRTTSAHQQPLSGTVVDWMILCQLCEHYPECLPDLPDRADIMTSLHIEASRRV